MLKLWAGGFRDEQFELWGEQLAMWCEQSAMWWWPVRLYCQLPSSDRDTARPRPRSLTISVNELQLLHTTCTVHLYN